MQLRQVLDFHSGINNLNFLLLYDIMLLRNWLVTFREKVGVLYSKGQNDENDFALWQYNHPFFIENFGKPLKMGCNHIFDDDMWRSCGTHNR